MKPSLTSVQKSKHTRFRESNRKTNPSTHPVHPPQCNHIYLPNNTTWCFSSIYKPPLTSPAWRSRSKSLSATERVSCDMNPPNSSILPNQYLMFYIFSVHFYMCYSLFLLKHLLLWEAFIYPSRCRLPWPGPSRTHTHGCVPRWSRTTDYLLTPSRDQKVSHYVCLLHQTRLPEYRRGALAGCHSPKPDLEQVPSEESAGTYLPPTCLLSPWVTSPCKVGGLLGGSLSRAQLPLRNQDHDHTWPVFADSCEGQPRRLTKSLGKNPNSSTEGIQILIS